MRQFAQSAASKAGSQVSDKRTQPESKFATLQAIAQRISRHGAGALSDAESVIWNTAAVIFFMTGDNRLGMLPDAKIFSWGAARAGFREMGLPALGEVVRLLVIELAYRADLDGRNRAADSASLLRIAKLKQQFEAAQFTADLHNQLQEMIARAHGHSTAVRVAAN
ncbi:MAG: hypothetical protein KKA44_02460 [Alphaproteobacteria bacterium]|nr:hypothetical protein [Alphaproteobacteria bacterium]MBU0864932.1 hypothetical protein [Alphaproteobacteria bacterium]MBU1823826.1 hypothetical protein [Alphaproteobacteria bacterium]